MKPTIGCDMGEDVTGIGYRYFGAAGNIGARITAGINHVSEGVYCALEVTIPAGALGVRWDDASGLKEANVMFDSPTTGDDSPHETCRRLISDRFNTLWAANPDKFPVVAENHDPPERAAVWGMLTINQAETSSPIVGEGHERAPGAVFLSVFIKPGGGTKAATKAADWFGNAFNNIQLREGNVVVTFRETGTIDAGTRAGYVQKNIVCRFHRDCYP